MSRTRPKKRKSGAFKMTPKKMKARVRRSGEPRPDPMALYGFTDERHAEIFDRA